MFDPDTDSAGRAGRNPGRDWISDGEAPVVPADAGGALEGSRAPLLGGSGLEPPTLASDARPGRSGVLRTRLDRAILASGGAALAAASAPAAAGRVTGTAPAAPAGETQPAGEVTPQVVRAVLLSWRDGVGEARVRLEPESLGTLTVVLRVERGTVTATVSSEVAAVRESIQAHERDLRAGLAEHGLALDRLVVTDDRPNREGARGQEARAWRAPRRAGQQGAARFEVEA